MWVLLPLDVAARALGIGSFGDWIAGVATDGFGGFVLSVFAAIAYMIAVSAAIFVSYKAMMLSLARSGTRRWWPRRREVAKFFKEVTKEAT